MSNQATTLDKAVSAFVLSLVEDYTADQINEAFSKIGYVRGRMAQPAVSEEEEPSNPPPLPEPFTVASTMKCTACGAPYEPARALAPMAAAAGLGWRVPAHACKCGNTQFGGTVSYDSPSPAQFTGQQMNDRWADGWKTGYNYGAWAGRTQFVAHKTPNVSNNGVCDSQVSHNGDHGMQHE